METRTSSAGLIESETAPIYSVSWGAVIAGLAVGLGVHLLFLLLGASAGLAVYGAGMRPEGETVSLAAAIWNGVSMLISALVGGYVAARACGLRRTSDGVLHALASWGITMLFFAVLTTSVAGNALSGAYGMAAASDLSRASPETTINQLIGSVERGDRAATIRLLRDRFGLNADQATSIADRALAMSRSGTAQGGATTEGRADDAISQAARGASAASIWLSLVVLLSLGAGVGGGVMGAHGNLNRSLPSDTARRRTVIRRHTREGLPTMG